MFDENHLKPDLDNGGRITNNYGYIMIRKPSHPFAQSSGYISEHRLVMEVELGRYLTPDEVVHHKNRIKDDNRPDNLEVVDRSEHRRIHNLEDKIYDSKYDLDLIRELYLEGKSTRDIEEIMSIGKSTVGYYIRKWGISREELSGAVHLNNPLNERMVTNSDIDFINSLRRSGLTIREISKEVGYSESTVHEYMDKDITVDNKKYKEISCDDIPEIFKLYFEDGMSQKEIADRYGSYRRYIGLVLNGKTKHFKENRKLNTLLDK